MVILKVAPIFLLVLVAGAEKKIELQDIEEDNLKSEKESEYDDDQRPQISSPSTAPGLTSLDFLKNGFLRYFEGQVQPQQQTRYVQQYAVTEQPERPPVATPKSAYGPPAHHPQIHQQQALPQQAMVGYLSNVPMQIYLVPQYYNEAEQGANAQLQGQYAPTGSDRVPGYPTAPEAHQTQTNYIQVPTYVTPTQKTYIPQYTQPVTYVSIAAPTAPAPTVAPVLAYQIPVVVAPQTAQKVYYPDHYTETNTVEDGHEDQKQYTHTDISYAKPPPANEYRYYSNRPPPREEFRHSHISELPHPNSLLLKPSPPHLSHIPKALPIYRPAKPVYGPSPTHPPVPFPRPGEPHGPHHYKRRPTSLLDSYVPSSLQVEYMKRGYTNDPLVAYEALSSGRHFAHAPPPRHYERGFLPNQMYHTAHGGVTFGHYKRSPKIDKAHHK